MGQVDMYNTVVTHQRKRWPGGVMAKMPLEPLPLLTPVACKREVGVVFRPETARPDVGRPNHEALGLVLLGPVRRTDLGPRTGPDWDRSCQDCGPGPSEFF